MPSIRPSQKTPVLPNMRRVVMRPSGASCSRRNSAKLVLATMASGSFDREARAIRTDNFHAASRRAVWALDTPNGVVHPHGAVTVLDRLFKREHTTDKSIGPAVEKRTFRHVLN